MKSVKNLVEAADQSAPAAPHAQATIKQRLEAAASDLATAECVVAAVHADEDAALSSAEDHAEWRARRDAADIECHRLRKLVTKLTGDLEADRVQQAAAAQRKLEADADAMAHDTGDLIRSNLEQIEALVRATIRASAEVDIVVDLANKTRDADLPRIMSAEQRARALVALPETVVSETIVERFVYEENGQVLSDENSSRLVPAKGGGYFLSGGRSSDRVVARKFKRVEFLPKTQSDVPNPLASTLFVPGRAAGMPDIWPGERFRYGYSAAAVLEFLAESDSWESPSAERTVEVRFEPCR